MVDKIGDIKLEVHDGVVYRLSHYYDIQEVLGKGGFGMVVQAYDKYKEEIIAMKVYLISVYYFKV